MSDMRVKRKTSNSMNVKLLTVIFVGMLIFAVALTLVSSYFIHSVFDKLYEEKLSAPGRTLMAQYNYRDISRYVEILKDQRDSPEAALQYKDAKYREIFNSLLNTQTSTGVKNLYILADIGNDELYAYVFNAFYEADVGAIVHNDFGSVALKTDYPEIGRVYETAEPVYIVDKELGDGNGKISRSFTPVTDGYGNVIAIICVDVNLESVSEQLNQFLLFSAIVTLSISVGIMFLMWGMLQRVILSPIKNLTDISSEIAQGNVTVEIPKSLLMRRDEMGVLVSSYESMRAALEKLIENNKSLFEDIIIGNLDARGDSSEFSGLFARLIDSTNETLDVIGRYFNSIPASFAILDSNYDIAFSNALYKKNFAGYTEKQIIQELLEDRDENISALKTKFGEAIRHGELNCLRWFEVGGENRCFSFLCSNAEQGKNRNGAVIVIHDNTELVLSKEKALSANRAKSEFLSRISHELRTPLNAVMSMAKLGLGDRELNQSMERFQKIVASSAHLSNIINDVLEVSRMESGKTEIRYAPMNVAVLVKECVDMLSEKADENNDRLLTDIDAAIPERLSGDEFRIKQILLNLLSNAIKFTKDGKISVSVEFIEKTGTNYKLRFTVTDTGIGMSPEFLEKIFQPFEQEENFLSRRYVGSGLGLSISNSLVTLMGGAMKVESELNKGSRFVFEIEFETADGETEEAYHTDETDEIDFSFADKRVLLVDDVEINRMIVLEVLADSGVEIEEAQDGEEAVEKFKRSPVNYYDLILMDIQMPKMDGYNATVMIRESGREDSGVPIVAMTANALKEDIDMAMECGMNDHLSKPIDFDLCIKKVKKYCST